jgi:hypothetical protein
LRDLSADGRIIFKIDLTEMEWGMEGIDLAQDRDRLWAVVNAVMNVRVPYNARNSASMKGFCSMELVS